MKGFSLIEAVVSVAILAAALAGPMTLASHSLKASGAAREETIATHLAEEGLEVVQSLRDNVSADDSTLTKTGWMGSFFANCDTAAGCVVDPTQHVATDVWNTVPPNLPLQECTGSCGDASVVYINPATGLYRQSITPLGAPWAVTPFHRTVFLAGIDASPPLKQLRVTSVVTYPGYGGGNQTVTLSQDLYNWFPYLH